ncbi:hypothetical protein JTB14_026927 [Gonioctena quinquepunctata]|nr:hypothetical protein JTB14_026927 [Gonioctena quinquepunctata]
MDYGAIAYNSCRPSRLKQLNNLQMTALRLATGAFRTSPAVAVQCDSTILPLNLRRDLQTISYATKVQSQPLHINHSSFSSPDEHAFRPTATRPTRIRFHEACRKYSTDVSPF